MATIEPGAFANVDPGPILLALESLSRSLPDPESQQVLHQLHAQLKVRLSPARAIRIAICLAVTVVTNSRRHVDTHAHATPAMDYIGAPSILSSLAEKGDHDGRGRRADDAPPAPEPCQERSRGEVPPVSTVRGDGSGA